MPEKATLIKVQNLTKSYRLYGTPKDRFLESCLPFTKNRHILFHAIHNISFEISKGDIIGIIGRNGSGKSTLLKIITGVLTPTSGTVEVNGNVSALLELGAGFNPEYTGIENIRLAFSLQGFDKTTTEEMIPKVAAFADVGEHLYQPIKTYSSGMTVRLAFAVAISQKADILIVDEALSVGDAAFQVKCMSYMRRIMASGTTILFVSHDTASVKQFCNHCIYLEHGRIKAQGPSREITDMYARDLREEISEINRTTIEMEHIVTEGKIEEDIVSAPYLMQKTTKGKKFFKNISGFHDMVKTLREGSGEARFTYIEILDENGEPCEAFDFDQRICIRLHFCFHETTSVYVGYHIRNAQNMELLSSDTKLEGYHKIKGNPGDCYVVDFYTHIPLTAGNYNIQGVLSHFSGNEFFFLDVVEPCAIFRVHPRKPQRIWAAVYIPNDVIIHDKITF